jgi:hypothetical protein
MRQASGDPDQIAGARNPNFGRCAGAVLKEVSDSVPLLGDQAPDAEQQVQTTNRLNPGRDSEYGHAWAMGRHQPCRAAALGWDDQGS